MVRAASSRRCFSSIFETLLQKKGLLGDFHVADGSRNATLLNDELSALLDETRTLLEGA